ncbi:MULTISPECIES: helix-turn-helix domain-containing protein [Methylomicrobium]|uniref:Putative transcriptional regulator n=1 Tax=Methylomicrobium album BG8 TaxID=686340 RepID=H8GG00_METAL|nr:MULTISPECIES: helix-turn-helix domain-containing protein [Methylomicrobium]EIC28751.1 putative transcriptional regulator [Methylomicrobium album BG8]
MSVNDKIRLMREAKELTQEQVAEKLEMSKNGYGDIERGDSDIKLSKLAKLAEIFEVQLPELVDLSEKGALNVNFACKQNNKHLQSKVYIGSSNAELDKQQLIIELKDKELALLQREIENLKIQIAQLQKINALLEKDQGH